MPLPLKLKDIIYPPYLISRIVNIVTSSNPQSYKDIYLAIETIFEEAFTELGYKNLQEYFSENNNIREIPKLSIEDLKLYQNLSDLRQEIGISQNLPLFLILDNKTLRYLAFYKPITKEEMIQIPGIKEKKYEQYGELFLKLIKDFVEKNKIDARNNNIFPFSDIKSINHSSTFTPIDTNEHKISEIKENYQTQQKKLYIKAYEKRTPEEEEELKNLFYSGKNINEISTNLHRNPGGIKARLIRLGLRERG